MAKSKPAPPAEVELPRPMVLSPCGDWWSNAERKDIVANPAAFERYDFGEPKQMGPNGRPNKGWDVPTLKQNGFIGLYFKTPLKGESRGAQETTPRK